MKLEINPKLETSEAKNILKTTKQMLELLGEEVLPLAFTALLETLDEAIKDRDEMLGKLALAKVLMEVAIREKDQETEKEQE